jgi:hypothetical protein
MRCAASRPLSIEVGLTALHEAGCRDPDLARSVCPFLQSAANEVGLVPPILETALASPHAAHWSSSALVPDLNPAAGWQAPGPAAVLEWRGRGTLEAIRALAVYGRT